MFMHSIWHEGAIVCSGEKNVLRTDVMYQQVSKRLVRNEGAGDACEEPFDPPGVWECGIARPFPLCSCRESVFMIPSVALVAGG